MQLSLSWKQLAVALIMAAALGLHTAQAQECKKPKVFFVNGVLNQQWEAQDASRKLEAAITGNGGPANLHITTIYNPTDPGLGDALEVAQDYVLTQNHLFLAFVTAFSLDVATASSLPLRLFMSYLTDDVTSGKTYSRWLTEQIEGTAPSIRNEDVIAKIQSTLLREVSDNKTPVVVIAHSEGNFYLNEAIRRLKTAEESKNIPGVQAIGVLGIGVASRFNPATLPSGQRLYRYVTKADDAIIVPLKDVLAANFTDVVDDRIASSTLTHHELVTDYLYPNVKGTFNGTSGVSVRKAIAEEFTSVYNATSELFPCVDTFAMTPTPVVSSQPVTIHARAVSRVGAPIQGGVVVFTDGGSTEFCRAVPISDGNASCTYTFGAGSIPQTINVQWKSDLFQSVPESFDVNAGGTLTAELVLQMPAPPAQVLVTALDASGAPGLGSITVQDSAGRAVGADVSLGSDGRATLPFDYTTSRTYTFSWLKEGQVQASSQVQSISLRSAATEWFTHTGAYIWGVGNIPAVWIINGYGSQADSSGLHPLYYYVDYLNFPTAPSGGASNLATIEEYIFDKSGTRSIGYGRLLNASYPGPGVTLNNYSCRKMRDGAGTMLQNMDFVLSGYGPVGAQIASDVQLRITSCGSWTSISAASAVSSCRRDAGQPAQLVAAGSATGSARDWPYLRIGLSGFNTYFPSDGSCSELAP